MSPSRSGFSALVEETDRPVLLCRAWLEPTRDPLCVGLMPICTGPSTQWVHAVRLGPGFVTAQWGGMTGRINVEIVDGGCG